MAYAHGLPEFRAARWRVNEPARMSRLIVLLVVGNNNVVLKSFAMAYAHGLPEFRAARSQSTGYLKNFDPPLDVSPHLR